MAGESSSQGSSFNNSQSTSIPQIMDSAQSDWGLMQSQLLNALADKTYQWSMQQYAKGEQVSDQTIANFMEMSGKGKGLADTLLTQYRDQIKPLFDKYLRDAGSYASDERQAFEAGKAMSTVAQADKAAMKSAMEKIAGYGGNVNAGKTQDMIIAGGLQDAAARAGAGTAAAERTEATGRAMEEKALAMGWQLPDKAMGAIQSSYAGLQGAENAILGLLNTGKNLVDAAAPYHNAAVAANKLPPVANKSQSTSQGGSQQSSQSQQRDPPQKGGGDKGGGKQPGQGQGKGPGQDKGGGGEREGGGGQKFGPPQDIKPREIKVPQTSKKDEEKSDAAATGGFDEAGFESAYPPILPVDDSMTPQSGAMWGENPTQASPFANTDPDFIPNAQDFTDYENPSGPTTSPYDNIDFENPSGPTTSPYANTDPDFSPLQQDFSRDDTPNVDTSFDPLEDFNDQLQDFTDYENPSGPSWDDDYDEDFTDYENPSGVEDTSDDDTSYPDDPFVGDDSYPEEYDNYDASSNYPEEYDNYDESYPEEYDNYDESYPEEYDNYYPEDEGGYDTYDEGGYDTYDEGWARGGQVRARPQRPMGRGVMPTTGGPVPRSASPSRGRQTDDISARLNAGEYVIPRDVVKHQGTKFFTDLIAKSRKLRTGMAGAKPGPTMRPALPQGRPTFRSRPLPPR